MSRYTKELPTSLPPAEVERVAGEYLQGIGFQRRTEKGEDVWRKGFGLFAVPQFVRTVPSEGTVHLEAWVSGFALLPGIYLGEQGLEGPWAFAIKKTLKTRVIKLEELLSARR